MQKWTGKKWLCLLMGWVMTIQPVFAQSKPSLIISPIRGKNVKPAIDGISNEFQKSGQVFIVDFEKVMEYVASKQQRKEKKGSSKEAVAAFEKGKKAYQNLDIKLAIESLEKSKSLYQDVLWNEDSFQGLRNTKFTLAMAYLADKKEAQARQELQEMILIDPKRDETKPSEKYYSPQVRQLYSQVLKEIKSSDQGNIQISSKPAQATVFMDGIKIGQTPFELRDVPVGRHYFRLVSASGDQEEFAEKVIVVGSNDIDIQMAQSGPDAYNYFQTLGDKKELDQARATYLDEMGLALGADIFLFLTPLPGKVKGQLYDQRSQELSHEMTAPSPQVLVRELLKELGADGYVARSEIYTSPVGTIAKDPAEGKPDSGSTTGVELKPRSNLLKPQKNATPGIDFEQPKEPPQPQKPWYQTTWVWVAIGAAVIGAGAGLYFGGVINTNPTNSTVKATIP